MLLEADYHGKHFVFISVASLDKSHKLRTKMMVGFLEGLSRLIRGNKQEVTNFISCY